MDNIKVSVIMPVYNSGKYLKKAVESILNQSLKELELILVDDGSTDGSSERCDEYAAKDPRVVVIHERNGGICHARNAALKIARGEYIGFSDHDDEFLPGCHEAAYQYAKENNLDWVKFGRHSLNIMRNGTVTRLWDVNHINKIYTPDEVGENYMNFLRDYQMDSIWDSLFKRSFLEKNNLRLNETFTSGGEDIEFNGQCIRCKPRYGTMEGMYYNHYVRMGFSTSSKFKEVNIEKALSFPERMNEFLSTYDENSIYRRNKDLYAFTILRWSVGSLMYAISSKGCNYSKEKKESLLEQLRGSKAIHPAFFHASHKTLMKMNPKYGLLYFGFRHRFYGICFMLYNSRNLRDTLEGNKLFNKMFGASRGED